MNQYIVTINLPENPSIEYMSLIPLQRDHINNLMVEGFITNISLSEDRTKLWINMTAESESEISSMLRQFPLIKFMTYEITKLFFHFSFTNILPQMSLN